MLLLRICPRTIVPLTHNRRYFRALVQLGLDLETLKAADLAPVDGFHVGGLIFTQELAAQMESRPALGLLVIGSGLGGPSRYFASEPSCRVTGVEPC